ncbi:MAG: 30S ribosomal protein S12 methylthiotransferase RimO [Deltaproteobacteria bacterium]|nr:30S ribosomal protein S12 methylthiotransferase RimO [Deltaproteobacteria bacterium]
MPRKIHFVSLGCAKNRVDTEIMLGVGEGAGYVHEPVAEAADVIVVNTCGFIGEAKQESIDAILEMTALRASGSCHTLVVAGCLSQRYAAELAVEMPEVDHFLGSSDMLTLGKVLEGGAGRMLVHDPAFYTQRASDPRVLSQSRHSAYVKIAEGCNRTCSFCAIPGIRGKQRSRSIDDIAAEVVRLVAEGVVEVNLVSQDTISYGRDLPDRPDLAALVARLAELDGLRWLRLHYLYPERLSEPLLELLADHPVVLPYVDMPLQHASDGLLTRMRRGHGGERLRKVVSRLRERLGDMVFRSTFIVGHPGETEADFEQLLEFLRWAEFDHVGVFGYSHEEGTASFEQDALVPEELIAERRERAMELQRPISRAKLDARVGEQLEVLVSGVSDESDLLLEGRFFGQAPEVDGRVFLANGVARPGELRLALVTQAGDYDLVADLLDDEGARDAPPGASTPTPRVKLRLLDE